jgi:transposase InsO family protein
MSFLLKPWHFVFVALCGWVNEPQQQVIEFQNAQIDALLQKLGNKRVLLTDSLFATDFTTVEVWTTSGLVTYYVMAVMHLKTRRVHIAGITPNPKSAWVQQTCRQLTDVDGFLKDAGHLIVDRDASFLALREFISHHTETEIVLLPPRSPDLNAYMERWFRSLKSECLDRMVFFGRQSLERAIHQYVEHFHQERNHQGLGNQLIDPSEEVGTIAGTIECRQRLGGMLKYYHRRAP